MYIDQGVEIVHIIFENRGALEHKGKKCIRSWVAKTSTCSGIWVGEEYLLLNKVKTQSFQAASSPLHCGLAKTS